MRCLFIKEGMTVGGTTTSFLNLLAALDKKDAQYDVWIHGSKSEPIELPDAVNRVEIPELDKAFAVPSAKGQKIWNYMLDGSIVERFKIKKHLHDRDKLIRSVQKINLCRLRRIRPIDLMHYDVVISWEEFFPCYLLAEKIKARHKVAWIHPDYIQCGFDKRLDQTAFQKLDRIVAVSEASCDSFKKVFPEMAGKFTGIRNNLNVDMILEAASTCPSDMLLGNACTLVTVARMQNISKAIDRALKIAERLVRDRHDFRWYFIGGGEDLDKMKRIAAEKQLNDHVFFLGERSNPYEYVCRADLFVLQSYYEGCPMVIDEAMLLKTPVLVSNYASAKEQVSDCYGVVANNDEDSIYTALVEMIRHPEQRLEYRRNLLQMDISQYSSSTAFVKLLKELYE